MNNSISSISVSTLPNRPIEDLNCRDVQIIEKIHGLGLLHINIGKNPYNPDIPIDDQPHIKHAGRGDQLKRADSLRNILQGIQAGKLPIFVPGSTLSKENICVIDIDYGGIEAAKEVRDTLGIKQGNCVLTKSGRQTRYHLWIVAKNPKQIIDTRRTWKTSSGGGDVLYRSCVTGWDTTKNFYKWLKRVKKGKVKPVDISGILDVSTLQSDTRGSLKRILANNPKYRPSKLPSVNDCPAEMAKRIDTYIDALSIEDERIRRATRERLRQMGSAGEGRRNEILNRLLFKVTIDFSSHAEGEKILEALRTVAGWTGLSQSEIDSTTVSACEAGLHVETNGRVGMVRLALEYAPELSDSYVYDGLEKTWYKYEPKRHWSSVDAEIGIENWVNDRMDAEIAQGRISPTLDPSRVVARLRHKLGLPQDTGWNSEPYLLGLPDGKVFDVRTGKARDGKPEDYIRETIAVIPRRGTRKERKALEKFMSHIVSAYPDISGLREDIIRWLQAWRGLAYLGLSDRNAKILYLYSSEGNTGKSTFIDTLERSIGDAYATSISDDDMKEKGNHDHPQHIFVLMRKRLIVNDDLTKAELRSALIKKLCTGGTLTGRPLWGRPVKFMPVASLLFAGNHIPRIDGDGGMQRRFILLPVNVPKRDDQFIEYITSKKMLEVWAYWDLEGAHRAVTDSASREVPAPIQAKSNELFGEHDIFERWVVSRLHMKEGHFTPTFDLEAAYVKDKHRLGWKETFDIARVRRALDRAGYPRQEKETDGKSKQKRIAGKRYRGVWHAELNTILD